MFIIQLKGGLGNQMFQYALGKALSVRSGKNIHIDISSYLNEDIENQETSRNYELKVFNIKASIISPEEVAKFNNINLLNKIRKEIGLPYNKIYLEMTPMFDENVFKEKNNVYFSGYWQSEKYFKEVSNLIKSDFKLKINLSENIKLLSEEISTTNSIGIHFRRGDYFHSEKTNNFHGVCNLKYYYSAIQLMNKIVKPVKYYIFSDDIDWVKKNISNHIRNAVYISHPINTDSWKDLYLMSLCKHNIIANSSYSWWSAWLNSNVNKIVIAPEKWYAATEANKLTKDLLPKEWIKL